MKESVIQQCVKILYTNWNNNKSRPNYHYAFAIKKNKIIEIGKNKPDTMSQKVFSIAKIYGIEKWIHFPYLHAESDLIIKLGPENIDRQIEILSLRINWHGRFRIAKPCKNCQKLIDSVGIKKVTWSCSPDFENENKKILLLKSSNEIDIDMTSLYIKRYNDFFQKN